jgi:hypothetical protein
MKISLHDFKTHIGTTGLHKAGLHAISRAHAITTKFYCTKLTNRSACFENCAQCILALKTRFDQTQWEGCQRPYGLYTWIVKDVQGKVVEVVADQQKASSPVKPLVITVAQEEKDVLDMFMETLPE